MSDSVRPHRRQPTRLPRPWDSPGKNSGLGCHFLLQCIKVKSESEVAQSCPTLSDPMDCSPPGSPSMGFSRQEYWSGVPLPSPRSDFSLTDKEHFFFHKYILRVTGNRGLLLFNPASLALQADSLPSERSPIASHSSTKTHQLTTFF